jgi:hypothetical protein
VNIDLRNGLVEVPGALPTFASPGVEERAGSIGRIASDSYGYIGELLGFRPAAQVLVVTEADWPNVTQTPLYGLPNAWNGTLVVAGTEAPLWDTFAEMVQPEDRAEFEAAYATLDGKIRMGPFMDLIAVHEVAHLYHFGTQHFPRLWLQELFANLCLHAWVADRSPADLATLSTMPRLGSKAPAESWTHSSREDFELFYTDMGGPNYVWYQFRLQVEAQALYERAGTGVVRRLFDAFKLDDAALARRLSSDVDPDLGRFSLGF